MSVDPRVIIKAVNPGGNRLGFDQVGVEQIAGGRGGWAPIDRPRRTAATEWLGTPAMTLTLPLMLSGLGPSGPPASIEGPLRILESWGLPSPLTRRPPILQVTNMVTVNWRHLWVLNELTYGDVMRGDNGHRVQAEFSAVLLQYIAPTVVRRPAARSRASRTRSS